MTVRRSFVSRLGSIATVLVAASTLLIGTAGRGDTPYELQLPRGLPMPRIPADNPLTWEKVELGRLLFYDTRLSRDENQSCSSCHQQAKGFTDGRARAVGSTGEIHPRSAMSLTNIAYAGSLGWADRSAPSLEVQILTPLFDQGPTVELGMQGREDELFRRLQADARYRRMFAEAFPGDPPDLVSIRTITQAIASFERTLLSGNSAFDRYTFGDDSAMSQSALRGEALFGDERHECFHCHPSAGGFFTASVDFEALPFAEIQFFNNALYNLNCAAEALPDLELLQCQSPPPTPLPCDPERGCHRCDGMGPQPMGCYPADNTGRYEHSRDTADMGRFKPVTLRNIAVTGPYMHDGTIATLDEVIDHYAAGGRTLADGPHAGSVGATSPVADQFMNGFALTARDKTDLLTFLAALTDEEFLANPRFSDPFAPVTCPGDCNFDRVVAVNELVTTVGISLDSTSLALCLVSDPGADGTVTVDELVRAIGSALDGCASPL